MLATILSGAVGRATGHSIEVRADGGGAAATDAATVNYGAAETLADAIAYVNDPTNAAAGVSTITFASKVTGIDLTAALPDIANPITIDGAGRVTVDGGGKTVGAPVFVVTSGVAGTTTLEGLTITGGDGADTDTVDGHGQGGGIYDSSSALVADDDTIERNVSATYGGGIYAHGNSVLTVVDSTIEHNSATAGGGILAIDDGTLTVEDSTVFGNRATTGAEQAGGGVADIFETATIIGSTITGNTAGKVGGGLYGYEGTMHIEDTVSAGNSATLEPDFGDSAAPGYAVTKADAEFSLIGKLGTKEATITTGKADIVGTAKKPVKADLGPLAWNGGPTETMLPKRGSRLIDAGRAFGLRTDQRGGKRTYNEPSVKNAKGGDGTDIGAVEVQPGEVVSGRVDDQRLSLTLPSAGICTPPGRRVSVAFRSVKGRGSPKLRFRSVKVSLGKHSASARRNPGTLRLGLSGLTAGRHTLKAVVRYGDGTQPVVKDLRASVTVC